MVLFRITFRCIRLWQLPARVAVASERVGLAVLSPRMADADVETVSQAADLVRAEVTPEQGQGDLLTILGALSEGLTDAATLRRIVGEGFVIRSKFIGSIVEDEINRRMEDLRPHMEHMAAAINAAEGAQRHAERQAEELRQRAEEAQRQALAARQLAERQAEELRQRAVEARQLSERGAQGRAAGASRMMSLRMVEDAIAVRFPAIAFPLVRPILEIRDSERLVALHHALLLAPDQVAAEQALRQVAPESTGQ